MKMQSKKKRPLFIAQDTQHKLGVAFSYLERNYRLKGIHVNIEMQITRFLKVLSQILLFQLTTIRERMRPVMCADRFISPTDSPKNSCTSY